MDNTRALFGPGGNPEDFYAEGYKHTYQIPQWLRDRGLDAYEYQAGNGVTGSDETFIHVGREAADAGIVLSFHAPYYISLSGVDETTRLKSVGYITQSLRAASLMGADLIVIHAGSASKISREQAMSYARDTLARALDAAGDTDIRFGIETMGKLGQLGTLEEVVSLCGDDPRLCPVVDFGHLNARAVGAAFRTGDDYMAVFDYIGDRLGDGYAKHLHCHFSHIEYTAAGEKRHLTFEDNDFGPRHEPLTEVIAKQGLTPRIICESAGTMAADSLTMKRSYLSFLEA